MNQQDWSKILLSFTKWRLRVYLSAYFPMEGNLLIHLNLSDSVDPLNSLRLRICLHWPHSGNTAVVVQKRSCFAEAVKYRDNPSVNAVITENKCAAK